MAAGESVTTVSHIAGATFSTSDLYKFVVLNSSGYVVLPDTTGNVLPFGVLYSVTNTTSSTGVEAVTVAIAGEAKVRLAASTLSAGNFIGSSTAGLGILPTTDAYTAGIISVGSSGAINRIVKARLYQVGPLSTP